MSTPDKNNIINLKLGISFRQTDRSLSVHGVQLSVVGLLLMYCCSAVYMDAVQVYQTSSSLCYFPPLVDIWLCIAPITGSTSDTKTGPRQKQVRPNRNNTIIQIIYTTIQTKVAAE